MLFCNKCSLGGISYSSEMAVSEMAVSEMVVSEMVVSEMVVSEMVVNWNIVTIMTQTDGVSVFLLPNFHQHLKLYEV